MNRRAMLALANVGVSGVAIFIWLRYPQYADYALYLLFGWFIASFSLNWTLRASPTASSRSASGSAPPRGSTPATPLPTGRPAAPIGFCIYCGNDLPVGAVRCPSCGHAVAQPR